MLVIIVFFLDGWLLVTTPSERDEDRDISGGGGVDDSWLLQQISDEFEE